MTNYNNSKIYKIYSHIGPNIYIGSTTKQYLSQRRMTKHRSSYKAWKNNKIRDHVRSFDLFDQYGIDNCKIELIEAKSCNDKDELRKLEGQYIRLLECVNKNIPGRTMDEVKTYQKTYQKIYREKCDKYQKAYHIANKKIINIRKKIKYQSKQINKTHSEYERIVREFAKLTQTIRKP